MLPPLKPISIKERNSIAFLHYGELGVIDGAFQKAHAEYEQFRVNQLAEPRAVEKQHLRLILVSE